MTEDDPKQSLITKQDDEDWAKVLHGEIVADEDNETHAKAQVVRNYLIARDEVVALSESEVAQEMSTLSPEQARVIYQRASKEIHSRARSPFSWLKEALAPTAITLLSTAVVLLILPDTYKQHISDFFKSYPQPKQARALSGLDYSKYPPIRMGGDPGEYPNMQLIAGGFFTMGCSAGWDDIIGCRANEYPPHYVSLKTFEMAQHEVTVTQFKKFVDATGYLTDAEIESRGCVHLEQTSSGPRFAMAPEINWRNPGFPQEGQHPVTCVSWADSQAYIAWISKEKSKQYRLPTEAEWEYAARAGKANAYYWGSEASPSFANYNANDDGEEYTSYVGKYPANENSLHDMLGNLWEWVEDCWHTSYNGAPSDGSAWTENCSGSAKYTRRGGAWDAPPQGIRASNRSAGAEHDRSVFYGFRIASDYKINNK